MAGFIKETGSIDFNVTSNDFPDIWDAVYAQSAVALYLYTETGAAKAYLYGNASLTGLSHDEGGVQGTVTGTVTFSNSDTTGFSRQTTA